MKKINLLLVMCLVVVGSIYSQEVVGHIEFGVIENSGDTIWVSVGVGENIFRNPAIPGLVGDTVLARYINEEGNQDNVIWIDKDLGDTLSISNVYTDILMEDMAQSPFDVDIYSNTLPSIKLNEMFYYPKSIVENPEILQETSKTLMSENHVFMASEFVFEIGDLEGSNSAWVTRDTIVWYCNGEELHKGFGNDTSLVNIVNASGVYNYSVRICATHTNYYPGLGNHTTVRWYNSDTITVDVLTFINNTNTENKIFTVYPNPTNNSFTIKIPNTNTNSEIKIYNLQGQIVYQQLYENAAIINVDTKMPQGIYFVNIKSNNINKTLKLIKN
jgi:hypothetical protein